MTTETETKWYQAYSPTGARIDRTYEQIAAGSHIEGFYQDDDGSLIYEHAGDTDEFWDACETVTRNGQVVFLDENGEEWTADQLTFKDDEGNAVTGPLRADRDARPCESDRKEQAARAMLAALRKVATCQTSHESAKRPPDFYEAAFNIFVADARAAIAQAEAVGITAE